MKKLLLALVFFTCVSSANADLAFKYGLGIVHSELGTAQTKFISFSYLHPVLFDLAVEQYELGAWIDTASGRNPSGFGSYSVGVAPQFGVFYVHALWGAGLITTTDELLGGHFQFFHDLGFGLKDDRGVAVGIQYKHISSAGLAMPNYGRDFLLIRMSLPF